MKNKILIVEDTPSDFERLQKILEKQNYIITHAPDGKTAFALLEEEPPDLVVLDIFLPDTDGFEICKHIRQYEDFASLPILFYTSSNNLDNKLLGLKLGASDFLVKGSDEREIIIRIQNLLDLKKVYDELLRLSVIDSLTHVYNRRYFQQRLMDEFERARRYKRDFCCVIIDVDHFKNINDSHGHPIGDIVLKKIAASLRYNIRATDVVCRYGGDEFGLILPETNFEGAYTLVERIANILCKKDVGKENLPIFITLSCGISSYLEGRALVMDELVTQADVALYNSKRQGRDQISLYGKPKVKQQ